MSNQLNFLQLNQPEMDATHREFMELLACAQQAAEEALPRCLDHLIEHTRLHFERESVMMRACGLSSQEEHESEHRRILADLGRMRARAGGSRIVFVRAYLSEAIPDWFRTHLATMDAELAAKYRQAAM
ncbi:MAG: bacteriohemerythrin [Sulfuricella denitrificans]|nr:bacteriohemerythrin [Sulfuricella denitrificans]